MKLFVAGRKEVFSILQKNISKEDQMIWLHAASLGEFEQGRPIIEKLKETHPNYKIVLTFFSPSGYEVRKDYKHANVICYLPLDTKSNAKRFLELLDPSLVIFVKYEFWPNYLKELGARKIPTVLISGIFRENQLFFKSHGQWIRNLLPTFSHFFVQDQNSMDLLKSIHFENATLSGDTRFDRVSEILQQDNQLGFIDAFKSDSYTLVAGSTWKEDEDVLIAYINEKALENEKFIIAPHNIKADAIQNLKKTIQKETVLFSKKEGKVLKDFQVLIVDTIGILTKIYSVADVAYVGGAFKTGLHNILEPAAFGVPIVIGPKYKKFNEAVDLVKLGGCISVHNKEEVLQTLVNLRDNSELRNEKGKISSGYIQSSIGATDTIMNFIKSII